MLLFNALFASLLLEYVDATLSTRSLVNATILDSSKVAMAWYAGWHTQDLPLSKVNWEKYTHLAYAFAVTTPDPGRLSLEESDEQLLPQFVDTAHKHNVKATLSIGGWTGSRYFSSNVGSSQNRSTFVKTVIEVATKYKLDGLDIDWEYPNRQGVGCNIINQNDTGNLLLFLQELRQDPVGAKMILSTATSIQPWNDTSNQPSKDLSAFAQVFDFVAIMNYNIYGPSSRSAGPNAPLNDTCTQSQNDRVGSAVSAVKAWSDAGIPLDKLVLGVPSFGQGFAVDQSQAFQAGSTSDLSLFPKFNAKAQRVGDKWDSPGGEDVCGNMVGPGGTYSFDGLMEKGFLRKDGEVTDGYVYKFDACSQTPYVYDNKSQTLVSYENVDSFAAKGDFIKSMGLKGFAIWEAAGDSSGILLDSILNATANGNPNKKLQPGSGTSSGSNQGNAGVSRQSNLFSTLILWSILAALVALM